MATKTSRSTTETKSRVTRKEPARPASVSLKIKDEAPKTAVRISAEEVQQRIRDRAYFLYVQRGLEHGHHEEDWTLAERQIKRDLNLR